MSTAADAMQVAPGIRETLLEIADRFGTPCYAYDLSRLRSQAALLRSHIPEQVMVYYSLKANASLGICEVLRECGLGADVASAGELATALKAGFYEGRIFVAGPYKSPETLAWLSKSPKALISVDSPCELEQLSKAGLKNDVLLRLRPDFSSAATVTAGAGSRFGFVVEELEQHRSLFWGLPFQVMGFHIFAGSQVLDADAVNSHLQLGFDLAQRAADALEIDFLFRDLGGGFGVAYGAHEQPLDLVRVGQKLQSLINQDPSRSLSIELGRFLVAESGWYVTRVVGEQKHGGRRAIIVDGGTHQRADLCGLCLRTKAAPPLVLGNADGTNSVEPTDVLGCLSLPADVLAEACQLPSPKVGDVLAFRNAGAYGLWASATHFHGYPLPAEIAFDGDRLHVMRKPQPAEHILKGQHHLVVRKPRRKKSVRRR